MSPTARQVRRGVLLGAGIVGVLLVAGGIYAVRTTSHSTYRADDPSYNRSFWKERITRVGAAAAYREFTSRTAQLPLTKQHFSAHVMGELLATASGPAAVSLCDSSFAFGCYHGVFTTLIAAHGPSMIRTLDEACVGTYGPLGTGCQHGIGHGILEYTGYEHLNDALALCHETTTIVPLLGCTSGVFMEFNAPLGGEDVALVPTRRAFNAHDPYYPCESVGKEYRASCFFELGGWLKQGADSFENLSQLCGKLTGVDRTHCFMGAGAMIAPTEGYDVAHVRERCAVLGDGEYSCRAGARWSFYQVPDTRSQAPLICTDPDEKKSHACETMGDLTRSAAR